LQEFPDRERAPVKYTLRYNSTTQNVHDLRRRIEEAFTRWYACDTQDTSKAELTSEEGYKQQELHDESGTVLTFLEERLPADGPKQDPDREALLMLARELLTEQGFAPPLGQFAEAVVQMKETTEAQPVVAAET